MPQLTSAPRPIRLDLTPVEVAARCRHLPGLVFFDSATGEASQISMIAANPQFVLKGRDWEKLSAAVSVQQSSTDDGLPHGFAAGYLEYEGDYCFGFYKNALIYRHADETWYEVGQLARHLGEAAAGIRANVHFSPQTTAAKYQEMVSRAQEYIAAGDVYQVNLAHRLEAEWEGDPFAFYEALRHYSPAPYGAFLALEPERQILSSSPESFLKMSGRVVRTRPIKGTRPRRAEPNADEKSAYDLLTSAKEIAELIMITDLERNDLGALCEFGSVSVKELLKLERYEQVFHLVSTVEGQLRKEVDHVSALRACSPGGSITGAPKRRARQIITELEAEPRGVYTGALGWFGFNGESQFNIAIRTVVIEENRAHFWVGAGIVADSVPQFEWQETLDKAAGILLAAERLGSPL